MILLVGIVALFWLQFDFGGKARAAPRKIVRRIKSFRRNQRSGASMARVELEVELPRRGRDWALLDSPACRARRGRL